MHDIWFPVLTPYTKWFLAFHVMSVIAWMAGLFYLPRLYVYHTKAALGSKQSETFKIMERRLLKQIMYPAMISSWIFGILLALGLNMAKYGGDWWHIKLGAAVLLTFFHFYLAKCRKDFFHDKNRHSERFYRFINEIPTVLMMLIVIMVFVRPVF